MVPGWRYKLGVGIVRILPGALQRRASIAAVRRYRRHKEVEHKNAVPSDPSGSLFLQPVYTALGTKHPNGRDVSPLLPAAGFGR